MITCIPGDMDTVTRGEVYTDTRVRRPLGQLSGKRKEERRASALQVLFDIVKILREHLQVLKCKEK